MEKLEGFYLTRDLIRLRVDQYVSTCAQTLQGGAPQPLPHPRIFCTEVVVELGRAAA